MQGSASSSRRNGVSNAVRKPRKSRGRGLRTTTGCAICRKRHLKCDEAKPACGPCSKGDRLCVYGVESTDETITSNAGPEYVSAGAQQPVHHRSQEQHVKLASNSDPQLHTTPPWPPTPTVDAAPQVTSPRSTYSGSTGYGTEVAPLRWFGLLATDAADISLDLPPIEMLNDNTLAQRYHVHARDTSTNESRTPGQISAALPTSDADERKYWQASEPVQLAEHEHDMFQRFVTGISSWIDLFDPLKHFATLVPHLAVYNEGLMKAVLALGARHLSIKPLSSGEVDDDRTAAVQYYSETLQYLQSAMRYPSYKNSLELLATVLVVSTYEMIDGASKGWERHLKGVFWIQRSREINGESGGLEQAIWWAWLRQDMWAAFRERRRCFSFFKPTKPYHMMDIWDIASRIVYILAQAVNYGSDEEKQIGETDLASRILRANTLLDMLEEWRSNLSSAFEALPLEGPSNRAFRPLWIQPPAFGTSLQMYSMARILLLIHQPAAGGYLEYLGRDKVIAECIDVIGGVALKLADDASRLMSTQCLFAAGLYCTDDSKRTCLTELIQDHSEHTGWPSNTNLADELRAEWLKQKPA